MVDLAKTTVLQLWIMAAQRDLEKVVVIPTSEISSGKILTLMNCFPESYQRMSQPMALVSPVPMDLQAFQH